MGVEPLDPGAQSIKIHPKIGNLSFAKLKTSLISGEVIVSCEQKQNEFALEYADKKLQKEFAIKHKKGVLPEISISGPELTYCDWIVKEKDIDSIQKVKDIISDALSDDHDDRRSHLIIGTMDDIEDDWIDYLRISIEHSRGEDIVSSSIAKGKQAKWNKLCITNKGSLIKKPKKGEFIFIYYYHYDSSLYTVNLKKDLSSMQFEIKTFQDDAVLVKTDYPDFDLTAEEASGGGDYTLKILCSDGQSFEGDAYRKEDLINKFSQYLIDKGVIKK